MSIQIYMNKKNTHNFLKLQTFLFSEALSMYNNITNENSNVWLQIYINKKIQTKFIKTTNISLLFRSLPMCNQITNENTDKSAT